MSRERQPYDPGELTRLKERVAELEAREAALRESNEHLKRLFERAPLSYQSLDESGCFIEVNQTWLDALGYSREEVIGRNFGDFLHPDWVDHFKENFPRFKAVGEVLGVEFEMISKDGSTLMVAFHGKIGRDPTGRFLQTHCIFRDITREKTAQEALRSSECFVRSIFDALSAHIAILNDHGSILDTNESWKCFARSNGLVACSFREWNYLEVCDRAEGPCSEGASAAAAGIRTVIAGVKPGFEMDYPCHSPGEQRWFSMRVLRFRDQEPVQVVVVHENITERKRAEERLRASLAEKEVLLREVHHRVKNNLAAIVGLLELQRQSLEEPGVRTMLFDLGNRIRSMSLVHEKLYRSDSLSRICFRDYIQALVSHLYTSFGSKSVRCDVADTCVEMSLDLAVPCGLIVNELVTNTLKHAFPDGRSGFEESDCCVKVSMAYDRGTYTLSVADNGVGLPPGFDWKSARTLGLVLVRMLGEHQLGGRITVRRAGGTTFELAFSPGHRR